MFQYVETLRIDMFQYVETLLIDMSPQIWRANLQFGQRPRRGWWTIEPARKRFALNFPLSSVTSRCLPLPPVVLRYLPLSSVTSHYLLLPPITLRYLPLPSTLSSLQHTSLPFLAYFFYVYVSNIANAFATPEFCIFNVMIQIIANISAGRAWEPARRA